tara:strand:- start:19250 stop:19918 length:669 start_codon:yes stop_codon:yes gene_type:complete
MAKNYTQITVKLNETDNQIEKKIFKSLAKKINKNLKKRGVAAMESLQKDVKKWVYDCPALVELRGATKLRGDLGLTVGAASRAADGIATAVSQTLEVSYKPWSDKLVGGYLTIKIQPSDFANVLRQSWAEYTTEKGEKIPWLSWLLTRGDDVIITGYEVEYGRFGRSGQARMTGDGSSSSMAFRIDPRFSGTTERNFITEAVAGRDKRKIIRDRLVKFLNGK